MGKIYSKDNRGYSAMPAASLALGIISILTTLFWYMSIIAGVLILTLASDTLAGIIDMIQSISSKTNINSDFLVILIKITGIAILTEFAVSVCKDSGENAIASKVDLGGKVIIMSMSIPIMSSLLETIIKILP